MIEYRKEDLERFAPNDEILDKMAEAEKRDDEEALDQLWRELIIPAETLLAIKDAAGADWIRNEGWNCSEAERLYGKDWLDRDIP